MKKTPLVRLIALTFFICLTGCKKDTAVETTSQNIIQSPDSVAFFTSVSADDISVSSDEMHIPNVKIDTMGYEKDDKKTVFFAYSKPNMEFAVVNAETKVVVYTGMIDRNQTGDFSDVMKAGTYFIEAKEIGRSKTFSIMDSRYESDKNELYKRALAYANNQDSSFEQKMEILDWLLRYDSIFENHNGSLKKDYESVEAILNSLKADAGIYKENPQEYAATICSYGALMANACEAIKEYDANAANIYLNEAIESFDIIEKEKDRVPDKAYRFYLSASLYRASGQSTYKSVTEKYLENYNDRFLFLPNESLQEMAADEAYVKGIVVYLNTADAVDQDLCSKVMKTIMKSAERFESEMSDGGFQTVSDDYRNRMLVDRLYVIAIVEHVIVSREYHNILLDAIHYVGGCNRTGSSFESENGIFDKEYDEGCADAELAAAYYYILGEVLEGKELEKMSMSSDNLEDDEENAEDGEDILDDGDAQED